MRSLILLASALVLTGCIASEATPPVATAPDASAPAAGLTGPVTVYESTIDFSIGTTGTIPLEIPAAAKQLTLAVAWSSEAPATLTSTVRIDILDAAGEVVANCGYATGVSQPAEQDCEQTNSLGNGPYELSWDGTGTVNADVLVTAQ